MPLREMCMILMRNYGNVVLNRCSVDDFKASLTCSLCGIKLCVNNQDKAKAVWLVKRHANENCHEIKAGWCLDANNHVVASKPKGKRQ